MANIYNPKTKRYEDPNSALNRPARNYNFKLPASEFGKKYLSYRYTPQEFGRLAQSGYVGSYGDGILGIKAPAYSAKAALEQIRKGNEPSRFQLPDNYVGRNLIDIATTPDPTPQELTQWNKRAEKYDLQKYIAQNGHPPSEDSVYYQFYNPSGAAAPALEKARGVAVEAYQKEKDSIDRGKIYSLATATKDPNLMALNGTLPFATFTPAQRAKVRSILRDFGLTAAGGSTVPQDLGSKYLLPASALGMGSATPEPAKSIAADGSVFYRAAAVSPVLSVVAQNATIQKLTDAQSGPLAPTPADEVTPFSFLTNTLKGVARAGLGLPMGVYTLATDPIGSTKAILKDYGKRYGALWGDPDSNFIASTLEDPVAPILDVLGLIPVVGAGAKAAQLSKIARVTSKGATSSEAIRVADARSVLEAAAKQEGSLKPGAGVWAEKGAGIMEARGNIAKAEQLIADSSLAAKEKALIVQADRAVIRAQKIVDDNAVNKSGLNAVEEAAFLKAQKAHLEGGGSKRTSPKAKSFIDLTKRSAPEVVALAKRTVDDAANMVEDRSRLVQFDADGNVSRLGESVFEFAKLQRSYLNGDAKSSVSFGDAVTRDGFGLNSAYAPTIVDRAAAMFTPRWTTFSPVDIMPDALEGDLTKTNVGALSDALQKEVAGAGSPSAIAAIVNTKAPIRYAGSPIARAFQKTFFRTQEAIAKKGLDASAGTATRAIAGTLMSLPLIGYNYRYGKALTTDVNSVGTHVQRVFLANQMAEELIDVDGKHGLGLITDAEQMAIMSRVSGKMYDISILRSIAARRLAIQREFSGDLDDATVKSIEEFIADIDTPAFRDGYLKAMNEMIEGTSERGKRLRDAAEQFRIKHDRIHHEAGVELSDMDVTALSRIYAPAINAFGLEPDNILRALAEGYTAKRKPKIVVFNDLFHSFETLNILDLPESNKGPKALPLSERIDNGEFDRPSKNRPAMSRAEAKKAYKDLMANFEASRNILQDNLAYRSSGNAPFFLETSQRKGAFGETIVRGRMVHIDGDVGKIGDYKVGSYTKSPEFDLPAAIMGKIENNRSKRHYGLPEAGKLDDFNSGPLFHELQRGSLNYLMKMFPDARDFADKVSLETMRGRETFDNLANNNTIAATGLMDYHLNVQFAAHKSAINRRFTKDIQAVVEQAAIPMSYGDYISQMKGGAFTALKTLKFHRDQGRADNYAADISLSGAVTKGEVMKVNLNGNDHYVTRMSFLDTSKVVLNEQRNQRIAGADVWKDAIIADEEWVKLNNNPNDIIMVVPTRLINDLTKSYARSENLASKFFAGSTDIFKLLALSLNPRFVSQQVFGGSVMLMLADPMNAPSIMARFMQYSARNMSRNVKAKTGHTIKNDFINHGDDYDIIMNRFIRDFEDNIYMNDAQTSFLAKYGQGANRAQKKAYEAATIGYTLSFALEKNLRVAIARQAALDFPGFKKFMESEAVALRAAEGIPDMGYKTVSPFAAAMDLLSDPRSPYHNPMFLREVRHTADMISGNYRDFTTAERNVRNYLIPFYAWTRHSAMFTKRLVKENPLTANSVYNTGNYGYEQLFERGGMPDWLLESVPMPEFVKDVLGVDPTRDNRIGFGSINPFGTSANVMTTIGSLTGLMPAGGSDAFEFTNPFINALIEQQTGKSLLTGAPLPESGGPGLFGTVTKSFSALPLPKLIHNAYTQEIEMNRLRGNTNPEDIFRDPYNPDSKLGIPEPKLNYKFATQSPAGLFTGFTPFTAYSLDPEQLGQAISAEFTASNLAYKKNEIDRRKGAWRTINALSKWKATKDFVDTVWMPQFGAANPEMAARVQNQLRLEYPSIPDTFPQSMVAQVLNGEISIPDAATEFIGVNPDLRKASQPVSGPASTEYLVASNSSDPSSVAYDRAAGSVNVVPVVTVSTDGYVSVNGRPYIDEKTGKQVKYVVNAKGEIMYDSSGNPIIDVKG